MPCTIPRAGADATGPGGVVRRAAINTAAALRIGLLGESYLILRC
jgi:hypothetical protein